MKLDIKTVLSEATSVLISRNGALIAGAYAVLTALGLGLSVAVEVPLSDHAALGAVEAPSTPAGDPPVVVTVVSQVLSTVFISLLTVPVGIIAVRIYVGGTRQTIPDHYLFHRIGRATVTGLGVSVVEVAALVAAFVGPLLLGFGIAVGADLPAVLALAILFGGVVLAVFLSVVVLLHFVFTMQEVAVQDRRLVGALKHSWATVSRDRLRVGALLIGLYAVVGVVGGSTSGLLLPTGAELSLLVIVGVVGAVLVNGVANAAWIAVVSRAYTNLRPKATDQMRPDGTTPDADELAHKTEPDTSPGG